MRSRTPQQKKELSYAKDRRNTYGANDKASRKSIPKRKASVNKAYRQEVDSVLRQAENLRNLDETLDIGDKVRSVGRREWKKWPDAPLGEVVKEKLQSRADHAGRGKSERKAAREFLNTLRTAVAHVDSERWMAQAVDYPHLVAYAGDEKRALEKLRHIAKVAHRNEGDANIRVEMDGVFITPKLTP